MTKRFRRKPPVEVREAYRLFFEGMVQNSLEEMVRMAWEVFGLPVILIDEHDQPICQYPNKSIGYEMWDRYYNKDPLEAEEREAARMLALSDKPAFFAPFLLKRGYGGEEDVLFGQISCDEKHYGYFAVYLLGNPVEARDLERAEIFSRALGTVMHHLRAGEVEALGDMLTELLAGASGEQVLARAVNGLGRQLSGKYYLLVKPVGADAGSATFSVASRKRIHELNLNVVSTIYQNCIVVLYGGVQKESERYKKDLAQIGEFLRPAGQGCGVSSAFDDLYDTAKAFLQAHMTALCGENSFMFYEDIAPAPIFRLVVHYGEGNAFCHPVLDELWRYDQKNKGEYFKTLRAYSLFLHDKDRAAEDLCVHRNTVVYRLNRIEEIFGLDFEEPRTALHLLNSFQLWDVMKRE